MSDDPEALWRHWFEALRSIRLFGSGLTTISMPSGLRPLSRSIHSRKSPRASRFSWNCVDASLSA